MKIFNHKIKTVEVEDWLDDHYDCPVKDVCLRDGNSIFVGMYCSRHVQIIIKNEIGGIFDDNSV